ncbi:MAG: SHOCT domain-containing protein [candidate division NC10 bacterium]|nr:SHOCT domain-containing protein [candidate division NC10 bacterium]MDE2321481.1 SHOCT domain-containing protein [candidate division NC10 bacterium]
MSVPVTCSRCATEMSVPDKYVGKDLKCLKCGAPFHVPQQTHSDTLASRVKWKIGGGIRNKGVLEYIANNLDPDEEIVATLLGLGEKTSIGALFGEEAGAALGGSYLLVTDKKVVIIKSGVGTWGTGSFGVKTKTFLYDHVASVDVSKRPLVSGEIEIVSSGMVEKSSGGFFAGASKDSVVQFEKKYFEEVQKLATRIRELAAQARRPKSSQPADIPGQIKKLAELRDAGILSEEEFAEQKRKLLSKL